MTATAEHPSSVRGSIAVITLSKNDPAGLTATLESLALQRQPPAEVIVVATGRSREVDATAFGLPIRIALDPGRGISGAFNAGIAVATGDWLMFLNGGDRLDGDSALARLAAAIDAAPADIDIVSGFARTPQGALIPHALPRGGTGYLYLSHQASVFRRACFAAIGNFSESYRIRMDLDWLARFIAAQGTQRIHCVDDVFVLYEGNGISSRSLYCFYAEELRILLRHGRYLPLLVTGGLRIPYRMAKWLYRGIFSWPRT